MDDRVKFIKSYKAQGIVGSHDPEGDHESTQIPILYCLCIGIPSER